MPRNSNIYKKLTAIVREVSTQLKNGEISVGDAEKILLEVYADYKEKESEDDINESRELISLFFPDIAFS